MGEVGRPKVISAKETLEELNPDVKVVPYRLRLTSENIMDIIADYDIVVDGSDDFPTRCLVDVYVLAGKPLSIGVILRFEAQATTILPRVSACYRCVFPTPPPGLVPFALCGDSPTITQLIDYEEFCRLLRGS